jgi:hypothetical protein|tara:strand:- start:779 stop:943 length:165 start_codon:yes stop_codon:yes gene_type:complete
MTQEQKEDPTQPNKPSASLTVDTSQLHPMAKDLFVGILKATAGAWIAIKLIIGV